MSKLKNEKYAGQQLVSSFGILEFNAEGILVEPKDLPEEAVKSLATLKGFEAIVEEKKVTKAEEPKEEAKAPEKAPEEAEKPKRSSRRNKTEE